MTWSRECLNGVNEVLLDGKREGKMHSKNMATYYN